MNRNHKLAITLLGILLLLQSGNMIFSYAVQVFPVFARLSNTLKFGVGGFLLGVIYYSLSMLGFFMQKVENNPPAGQITVAGRAFRPDWSFANPSNHVILAALLVFASLATIFAAQI